MPHESVLGIQVEIAHTISSDNTLQPFCRAFYIFMYVSTVTAFGHCATHASCATLRYHPSLIYFCRHGEHTETLKRVLFTVQDVNSKALKIDVASEMTSATLHSRLLLLTPKLGGGIDQHQADMLGLLYSLVPFLARP